MSRIKLEIKKIGAKLKMVESLDQITNHPKINMEATELERIIRNKHFYRGDFPDVIYINSEGKTCNRPFRSLNVPKILSRKLSKLVFNEGVSIELNDTSAQEFIDEVLKLNRFEKNFGEELEGGYAVSGLVIRPVYDPINQSIKLTYCSADNFFPLSGNANNVDEGALRTVYTKIEKREPVFYTLLEIHERTATGYEITNELYRSTSQSIVGISVPLDAIEETASIEPHVALDGFTKPLFTYIKLAGKNNISYGSPLGLGVIDNAYKQFFDLNEKYDQFMWEIEEAGRKIMASDHFFKTKFDANGRPIRHFDSKTQVFQKLRADEEFISEFAPSLRSAEFIESINFILRIIEMQNGFSAGTFSFDGQSVKTATEIVSENTDTFQTRQDNVLIVSECLSDLVISILELGSAMGVYSGNVDPEITIDFDDGVFTDKNTRMDYNIKAITIGIMSKVTAMMSQFGWSEEEALKELERIQNEGLEEPTDEDVFGDTETPATDVPDITTDGASTASELASSGTTVASVSMNGAQITSMVTIVQAVAKGELPRDSGLAMMLSAFPFTSEQAEKIMGDAGKGFTIEQQQPQTPIGQNTNQDEDNNTEE